MKKIVKKMALSNWGGISNKILEFNEYINLFSGMSGSGKSTVMDAIQVILYGSVSSGFLNKAADDTKNKRSVMNYLRGEQKDGSANRSNQDFHSILALDIEDKQTHIITSVGVFFEVHKKDTELKNFTFFSHSGPIPEGGYINKDGYPYSKKELSNLINERKTSRDNRGRIDVNKFYSSKEAYTNNLYDVILGYIDNGRFQTMQKSSIALKMTNGTSQFIRDYMFPKSEGTVIEKLSEQLGAYRGIKEKIDEVKTKIDLLSVIKDCGIELINTKTKQEEIGMMLKCIDIMDAENKMSAWNLENAVLENELVMIKEKKVQLKAKSEVIKKKQIDVESDIKASDLGSKRQHLVDVQNNERLLSEYSSLWRNIVKRLKQWGEDEIARDYISNSLLELINMFCMNEISTNLCIELKNKIKSEKNEIDKQRNDYIAQSQKIADELNLKKQRVDDIKNNRKSYSKMIRQAQSNLEDQLSTLYHKKVKVHVFADMFDVVDEEWKDAVEGRMGNLKLCLITEPQYAHTAAKIFRSLKMYEEVNLVNSGAIMKADNTVLNHSLYEAVAADEPYIRECLKHYIGKIIKCSTVEELENVRDGVTSDCYSYNNFIFRHLRKKDYTTDACIGRKVSRDKLAIYEEEIERLNDKHCNLCRIVESLKCIMEYESLNQYDTEQLLKLAHASQEQNEVLKEENELKIQIEKLSKDEYYKQLENRKAILEKEQEENENATTCNDEDLLNKSKASEAVKTKMKDKQELLDRLYLGYVENQEIKEKVQKQLDSMTQLSLKNHLNSKRTYLENVEQEQVESLSKSRNDYIKKYPSCGFNGSEKSNDVYLKLLNEYMSNYKPEYQKEFDKQCQLVYNTLKQNVIAKIHGDIKAAMRHKNDINRMLRDTTFSDSTYQIKIEAAKDEKGQYYEMLMDTDLDTKNPDYDGVDGQISIGDDIFYEKYQNKINLLIDKFMPPKEEDERSLKQSQMEMEKYADYRTYLQFNMYEQVTEDDGTIIRENYVDEMAGRDSGGEGQNPKYVALLAGFAMLYMNQSNRDSKIKLVLLDEAFSKMDQKRSEVCLKYARKLDLQLIVCVPDERLQSLIRNVDSVYGFRRNQNQITMMHIDKGQYLKLLNGE